MSKAQIGYLFLSIVFISLAGLIYFGVVNSMPGLVIPCGIILGAMVVVGSIMSACAIYDDYDRR